MHPPPSTAGVGTCPPPRAGWWPPPSGGGVQPSPTTRPPPSGGGTGRGHTRHIAPSQWRTRVSSPSSSDSTFRQRSQRSSRQQIHFSSSSISTSHSVSPDHSHRRMTKGEGHRRRKSSSSSSSSRSNSDHSRSSRSTTGSSRSRSRHRRKRKYRHSHQRCRYWSDAASASSVSCAPPVPSKLRRKIRRGEYVEFKKLLLPINTPPLLQPITKRKQEAKRTMTNPATWLEAWNHFLCCHLSYFPTTALEMAKYQTLLVMLFAHHPPQQCLEYDHLRQLLRTPPSDGTPSRRTYMSGPSLKRASPFGTNQASCSGSVLQYQAMRAAPIPNPPIEKPIINTARRSASATTSASVPSVMNVSLPIAAGNLAATRRIPAEDAPNPDSQRGQTPLRHSHFGRELANHPDKAWVSWLLDTIRNGVSLGYTGPRLSSYVHALVPHCDTTNTRPSVHVQRWDAASQDAMPTLPTPLIETVRAQSGGLQHSQFPNWCRHNCSTHGFQRTHNPTPRPMEEHCRQSLYPPIDPTSPK